jgi:hypothetical protein
LPAAYQWRDYATRAEGTLSRRENLLASCQRATSGCEESARECRKREDQRVGDPVPVSEINRRQISLAQPVGRYRWLDRKIDASERKIDAL